MAACKSCCDKLVVAAIDFGTTYSGYAFSFKHDYEKEPTKVPLEFTDWIIFVPTLIPEVCLFFFSGKMKLNERWQLVNPAVIN